jgi:excisionase family DNA binding protein
MTTKKEPKKPRKPVKRDLPDEERTLTVQEVAELDSCSERTVRRAIAAGLLEATRVGPGERLWRITRKAHAQYRRARST